MEQVSILMSTYNETERFIRESIESIINQSFKEWELIIVNDNPNRTDVAEIIDSYGDSRIFYVQNDVNIGLAMCMNKAATLAHGDILVRMDADDVCETERLKTEYDILTSKGYDLVFSSYTLIDEQSNHISRRESLQEDIGGKELSKMIALNPTCIHHPTVMMRRGIFEKVGGYRDFPCSQDADLWLRMQENGCRFCRINQPLLRYRVNSQSVSSKKWFRQRLTWYYIFGLSIERLKTGKDSYSREEYEKFLEQHGIGKDVEERKLQKSYNLLKKAKKAHNGMNVLYRIAAFLSHPLLRQHYFEVKEKRTLL